MGPDHERRYRFAWRLSYLGIAEYEVFGDGNPYRVEVRREASSYERSIFNGTEETWQRDVVAAIGLLRRSYHADLAIPEAVVLAFNQWRHDEHERQLAIVRAHPERYGVYPAGDPMLKAPENLAGAIYKVGHGWVVTTPAPAVPQAALAA